MILVGVLIKLFYEMHGATVKKEEKLFTIGHGVIFQDSFILSLHRSGKSRIGIVLCYGISV
jgi:hypothetical protein